MWVYRDAGKCSLHRAGILFLPGERGSGFLLGFWFPFCLAWVVIVGWVDVVDVLFLLQVPCFLIVGILLGILVVLEPLHRERRGWA